MTAVIALKKREKNGSTDAKLTRKAKEVPGVIYGDHIDTRQFSIAENKALQLIKLSDAGMIDVQIDGENEPVKVVIQEVQRHPVSGMIRHIDLYQVRMDRKLHVDISIETTGVAPAVKDLGGVLLHQTDELSIECLPKDLINNVTIDIAALKTFEDVIRVKDIALPEGVVTHMDPEQIVASVAEPRSEAEMEALDSAVEDGIDKIEDAEEKKADDEETAEGSEEKKED